MPTRESAPDVFHPLRLDQVFPFTGNDVTEIITKTILEALPSDGITFGITEGRRPAPKKSRDFRLVVFVDVPYDDPMILDLRKATSKELASRRAEKTEMRLKEISEEQKRLASIQASLAAEAESLKTTLS